MEHTDSHGNIARNRLTNLQSFNPHIEAANSRPEEIDLISDRPPDGKSLNQTIEELATTLEEPNVANELRHRNRDLSTLSRLLVKAQEAERRSLARELHNEIGQALTGLKILLEMAAIDPKASPATNNDLAVAVSMVTDLMGQVRDLSLNLRPAMLDDFGLRAALDWCIRRYQLTTKIEVDFIYNVTSERFPQEIETAAYRIIQEAITNAARHAQVGRVEVSLHEMNNVLELEICDQGVGFDIEAAMSTDRSAGLLGMVGRTSLLGGKMSIVSMPRSGTQVIAQIPLTNSEFSGDTEHANNHTLR